MISTVIALEIASEIDELDIGSTCFSEIGTSQRHVVVKTTDLKEIVKGAVYETTLQILVRGWPLDKSVVLARRIKELIETFSGTRSMTNSVGEVESYHIKSVDVINGPIPLTFNGSTGASVNVWVAYDCEIS